MNKRTLFTKTKHNSLTKPILLSLKTSSYAFQNKEEKLFGNKSFLEIILGLIKTTQNDVLSSKIFKRITGEFDCSKIKEILKELKQDLITINEEEKKRLNLNLNILDEKKKNLNEIIYNPNNSKNFFLNSDNENNDNLNNERSIHEIIEDGLWKELYQLKTLNFKIENEIIKMNNKCRRMIKEIEYIKKYCAINRFIKVATIYIKQNDNKTVNQILHNKLMNRRKLFIQKANMKNNQDFCINCIKDRINKFKKDIKELYQYYNDKIISEEERSYIETIVEEMKNNKNDYDDEVKEDSINYEINKAIMKEEFDINDKNITNKDSTNNEETCPNSSKNIE